MAVGCEERDSRSVSTARSPSPSRASLGIRPFERCCSNISLRTSPGRCRTATALGEVLVGEYTDENHRPHHRKVERARNAEQIDKVLQYLEQHGAEHNPYDRALAAAQRTATQHRSGDGVKLIERTMHRRPRSGPSPSR